MSEPSLCICTAKVVFYSLQTKSEGMFRNIIKHTPLVISVLQQFLHFRFQILHICHTGLQDVFTTHEEGSGEVGHIVE